MKTSATFALSAFLCLGALRAEDAPQDAAASRLNAGTFAGLELRNIGPALTSGRISDLTIDAERPNTWYVAVGSGGLWKTTNSGTTWTPIFDHQTSYSIGCVTIDPNNRHTIWVGTGEAVAGRHVAFGDGVYRSRDGGKSFEKSGLEKTEHIAKILVDPRDSSVVYVAAQGPLWSGGGERGLYKTTDGGKTWEQVLARGPYTGVTDIAFDPRDPDVIYAATHQRQRTVWALIDGGPESAILKSVDGGRTWRELTNGLPAGDKGKIAIAVSPIQPDVVYATIELAGRTGGFWRSADRGETWVKMSDYISGGTGPHYYQELFCDPHRFDVVYQVNVRMGRTEDGGRTWETVESDAKHVDNHAVAFRAGDPDFLLVGCDGGLYQSFDRGETFSYFANMPLTQFYKIDVGYDTPFYNIVGGTQDNNTQYGPGRTADSSGIPNSDWRITIGADGYDCAIDPEDPNIVYCEMQQGVLWRYDRRTGESIRIQPVPEKGEDALRFNWDAPILISPHSHTRLYFGSRKLHKSDDRGDSWTTISPDLSRGRERLKLKIMDRVWSIDAVYDNSAMSDYGNITSISESPLQEGLIYVGTDDGLIQVTEDGGANWRKIERIYGVPEFSFVNDIKADLHDVDSVVACFDNHKTGDLKPYLMRSTDRGRTWTSIAGDLPDRHLVWRFVQDHEKKDLCFLGTEFGLFFTLDGGAKWIELTGNVPTIAFRDIEIQRRENDLIAGSFGRSIFILDDYSPLRSVTEELLNGSELALFPVKKALLYVPARPLGRGARGSQGDAFYTAPNPSFGAVFTYYLRDALKTLRENRHEKEAEVTKKGGDNPPPGWDEIKREDRESEPSITFTITDSEGQVVQRVSGPTSAGFHRVAWNLRYPGFVASGDGEVSERGPLAAPGAYTVRATKRAGDAVTPLGEPQSFEVVPIGTPSLPVEDREAALAFYMRVGELQRAVVGANGKAQEALAELAEIQQVLKTGRKADIALLEAARSLELRIMDAREALSGDPTKPRRNEPSPPSVMARTGRVLSGALGSTYGPTKTHRRSFEIAREEYQAAIGTLRTLIDRDLADLERSLEAAGVPWTSGRPIPRLSE